MDLFQALVAQSEAAVPAEGGSSGFLPGLVGGDPDHIRPLKLPLFLRELQPAGLLVSDVRLIPPPPSDALLLQPPGQQPVEGRPQDELAVVKAPHVERGCVQ